MAANAPGPETSGCFPPDTDSSLRHAQRIAPAAAAPERPRIVQRLQRRHLNVRELQAEEPPARPQHPPRLGQHRRLVGAVAQPEGDRNAIHRPIRQRQPLGIGDHQRDVADQARRSARDRAPPPSIDALTSVSSTGPPPRSSQASPTSPVPAARSSSMCRGRGIQRRDQHALPRAMNAQRHQVVHQVVARRDAVEHRAHQAALGRTRHAAEAEIGGLGRCGVVAHARHL